MRPNILFMMADDHRWDAMGCAGNQRVATPFMDQMAADGCRFSQCRIMGGHSPAVCVPTRASVNTGCNHFRAIDFSKGGNTLDESLATLGSTLRAAGYRTAHTGKWHLDNASFTRSFEDGQSIFLKGMGSHWTLRLHDYRPAGDYSDETATIMEGVHSSECFADGAIKLMEDAVQDERPFFISCCFTSPHDPRTAPDEWHACYPADTIPLPANYMDEHPFDNGMLVIRDEKLREMPRTATMIREEIGDYYAMISHQDTQMERICAKLDELGIRENTIVV